MARGRTLKRVSTLADLALRGTGVALFAIAALTARKLVAGAHVVPDEGAPLLDYLLATITFLCGCAGSGLLCLGGRVFDRVPRRPPDRSHAEAAQRASGDRQNPNRGNALKSH